MAAQEHMDRLSAIDASFLAGEKESSHMHVGGVMIFEGPPPSPEDALAHIDSRLHRVPRYRLAAPPRGPRPPKRGVPPLLGGAGPLGGAPPFFTPEPPGPPPPPPPP